MHYASPRHSRRAAAPAARATGSAASHPAPAPDDYHYAIEEEGPAVPASASTAVLQGLDRSVLSPREPRSPAVVGARTMEATWRVGLLTPHGLPADHPLIPHSSRTPSRSASERPYLTATALMYVARKRAGERLRTFARRGGLAPTPGANLPRRARQRWFTADRHRHDSGHHACVDQPIRGRRALAHRPGHLGERVCG